MKRIAEEKLLNKDYFFVDITVSKNVVRSACKKLMLSDKVTRKALVIRDKILENKPCSLLGCTPRSFLTGVIHFSANLCGEEISVIEIHRNLGTSESTIRKASQLVSEELEKIPKGNFMEEEERCLCSV